MRAFIVRPFGVRGNLDFEEVEHLLIAPALQALDIAAVTTLEIVKQGDISNNMFSLLLKSELVIADISIHNANVFYELGVRHALCDRYTFLIRCRTDVNPFDLYTDRYLEYEAERPGDALPKLTSALRRTLAIAVPDSPLYPLVSAIAAQEAYKSGDVSSRFASSELPTADKVVNRPLRIFVSYSHKDEVFKDEVVSMLAGLARCGIVDTWQDRNIEAGEEWNKSIQLAIAECDIALLLLSADYLASRFIREEEESKLLQRRQQLQARVIPIVVRPCLWQSDPALRELQALPRDNRAIITFPKESGARDQVWMDIASQIEKLARTNSAER